MVAVTASDIALPVARTVTADAGFDDAALIIPVTWMVGWIETVPLIVVVVPSTVVIEPLISVTWGSSEAVAGATVVGSALPAVALTGRMAVSVAIVLICPIGADGGI